LAAAATANEYQEAGICPLRVVVVVTEGGVGQACLFPWFDYGNAFDFVQSHPEADRIVLVCRLSSPPPSHRPFLEFSPRFESSQIKDLAHALAFLHSRGLVMGNVHPVRATSSSSSYRPTSTDASNRAT
jgi:hypothetical protein